MTFIGDFVSFSVSAAGTILSVSFLCADISQMMKYGAKETQNIRLWNHFETARDGRPCSFFVVGHEPSESISIF